MDIKFDPDKINISIDADGNWRHEGVKITHERTLKLFYSNLDIDDEGRFFLQVGREKAFVQVDDAPFIVEALRMTDKGIRLRLNDESHELLDPASLRITEANVPYCKVRGGRMEAKFSRTAWYQLAEYIQERKEGGFALVVQGKSYSLTT
jgi:hypothetical protein